MPRALWRRRQSNDTPRPGGRRWAGRLYRGRVLARQVFRVRYRRRGRGPLTVTSDPLIAYTRPHSSHRRRLDPYRTGAYSLGTEPASGSLLDRSGPASGSVLDRPGPVPGSVLDRPGPASTMPGVAIPSADDLPDAPALSGAAGLSGATALPLLPGDRTLVRQLWFALVTGCTLASLSLGVLAILLAMRGDVRAAAICLVACVLLDGMDGLLARRLRVASPFGAQMDSLADMCAFGIAAPVVVYASVAGSVPAAGAALACALVAACAAIRLARFNVSPKDSRFFTGLPTTLAAAVLALAVLIELPVPSTLVLFGVAVLAFAMVSGFPYATLARLLRLPPWLWLAPVAGALLDARLTFVALVLAYLVSGPVLWLRQRRTA